MNYFLPNDSDMLRVSSSGKGAVDPDFYLLSVKPTEEPEFILENIGRTPDKGQYVDIEYLLVSAEVRAEHRMWKDGYDWPFKVSFVRVSASLCYSPEYGTTRAYPTDVELGFATFGELDKLLSSGYRIERAVPADMAEGFARQFLGPYKQGESNLDKYFDYEDTLSDVTQTAIDGMLAQQRGR